MVGKLARSVSLSCALWFVAGCRVAPDAPIVAYGDGRPVPAASTVQASLPPYRVASDLSNVDGDLPAFSAAEIATLAAQSCLITDSQAQEFYQSYLLNPHPFITSDSLFHTYHTLLNDTLVAAETSTMKPSLDRLLTASHKTMRELLRFAPADQKKSAQEALLFLTAAARLNGLKVALPRTLEGRYRLLISRVRQPDLRSDNPPSVFEDLGLEAAQTSRSDFRAAWDFLSHTPLPFRSDDELRTCLYVSRALTASEEWDEYLKLRRLQLTLSGAAEDPGPEMVMGLAGWDLDLRLKGSEPTLLDKVRMGLEPYANPTILDNPGSEPRPGLRIFPPGATLKARLFDDLLDPSEAPAPPVSPTGSHVAALMGAGLQAGPRVETVQRLKAELETAPGLHAQALWTVSALNLPAGEGYPLFMNSPLWALKTLNSQLAAWAQIEHDFDLFVKDNASYLGGYSNEVRFHGYVEPRPEFFERLAALVGETRSIFAESRLFDDVLLHHENRLANIETAFEEQRTRLKNETNMKLDSVWDLVGQPAVATDEHYRTLQELCLQLADLSRRELQDKSFTSADMALLAQFGETLKELSLNTSDIPEPLEPAGTIALSWTDSARQVRHYIGTGRPLTLWVLVPYQGKLHLTSGAISSYYEFSQPSAQPAWNDATWKAQVAKPHPRQSPGPWLREAILPASTPAAPSLSR